MRGMFEDFTHCLIKFYTENSTYDNVFTITTRKLLLPHLHSFLQLIKSTNDEFRKVIAYIHTNCVTKYATYTYIRTYSHTYVHILILLIYILRMHIRTYVSYRKKTLDFGKLLEFSKVFKPCACSNMRCALITYLCKDVNIAALQEVQFWF